MLRKIELMYSFFGIFKEKRQCKECSHFHRYMYRDKYYRKCEIYGETNSEASDWAGKYTACGKFNKKHKRLEEAYNDTIGATKKGEIGNDNGQVR